LVFDPKLNPSLHIEQVCCKALKTLDFVKPIAAEFIIVSSLKALYCSLVKPILEYCFVIWNPQTACIAVMLERVQWKFLKYAANTLKIECPNHDFTPVLKYLKLDTLANRRQAANLIFWPNYCRGKLTHRTYYPKSLLTFQSEPLVILFLFHLPPLQLTMVKMNHYVAACI